MALDTYVTPVVTASSTTWAQFKAEGLRGVLNRLATANPAKADPSTQATVAGSVATGGLAAGTYYFSYSFVDLFGETLAGGRSAQFTSTGVAQLATVTLPARPTGVSYLNLYVTPTDGAAGTERLYATGITGTTFACDTAAPTELAPTLPMANSTGLNGPAGHFFALVNDNPELAIKQISNHFANVLSGYPMERRLVFKDTYHQIGLLKAWYTALNEIGTLIWANGPGTYGYDTTGAGMKNPKRTLS
jgi:hypothetical protein